jgi:ethanolamine utilization microcompartment shell protein EutL
VKEALKVRPPPVAGLVLVLLGGLDVATVEVGLGVVAAELLTLLLTTGAGALLD